MVYYRHGGGYEVVSDNNAGKLAHTDDEDGPIITKT